MERPKLVCWADFSEDEYSETDDLTPSADPNKSLLLEKISKSPLNIFHLKIENLPYTIVRNEEIYHFLDVSDREVTIRMQYKGKKFIGCALAIAKTMATALKIATKYGKSFNSRSILVFYRPNETSPWIPQKKPLVNRNISMEILGLISPKIIKHTKSEIIQDDYETLKTMNLASPKPIMISDTAIVKALPKKYNWRNTTQNKFVFK